MKNKSSLKTILLIAAAVVAVILIIFLISKKDKAQEPSQEVEVTDGPGEETVPGEDGSVDPYIDTKTGSDTVHITPGGVEYSFIDTTGMTPEEIAELEAKIDADAEAARQAEENGVPNYDPNISAGSTPVSTGLYENSVLSCEFPSGGTLKIGMDTSDRNAIYLNPVYECTEDELFNSQDDTYFAFYFQTEYGSDITTDMTATTSVTAGQTQSDKYFLITGRTYDTLVPSTFRSPTGYGAKWIDINNYHGFDGQDCHINIRVVRLPDGALIGTAEFDVLFDSANTSYHAVNLRCSDVSMTGELSDDERNDLVERAFEFFCSDDKGQNTFVNTEYWNSYKTRAIVEKSDRVYFSRLFDAKGNVTIAGKLTGMHIYAVNINYPDYGFVTVYFAPQKQINGMRSTVGPKEDLQVLGYDAFKPFTASSLFVPAYQQEEFYK